MLPVVAAAIVFGAVFWLVPLLLAPRVAEPNFVWLHGGLVVALAVLWVVLVALFSIVWALVYRRRLPLEDQLHIVRGRHSGHRWLGELAVRAVRI